MSSARGRAASFYSKLWTPLPIKWPPQTIVTPASRNRNRRYYTIRRRGRRRLKDVSWGRVHLSFQTHIEWSGLTTSPSPSSTDPCEQEPVDRSLTLSPMASDSAAPQGALRALPPGAAFPTKAPLRLVLAQRHRLSRC